MYNGTGDVTTLVRIRTQLGTTTTETNVVAAEYTYSPYGEIVAVTGSDEMKDLNPIRYKGYYYDTDTGWYNLKTRYYDPMVGRFINADGYISTGQGLTGNNMYAYCGNDPVNKTDPDGKLWRLIKAYITYKIVKRGLNYWKKSHYNRNKYNYYTSRKKNFPTSNTDLPIYWKSSKSGDGRGNAPPAAAHQFSVPNGGAANIKYVSPDGKREVVYSDDNKLVTDPRDMGTYNFVPSDRNGPFGVVGHAIADVLPWIMWGNSPEDTTTPWERIKSLSN